MFASFIPALVGAFAYIMPSLIGRVLVALGISFVTFTGTTVVLNAFKTQIISSFNGLGPDALAFLGYLWIDKALTLVFSATVAAVAILGIGGSLKKATFNS